MYPSKTHANVIKNFMFTPNLPDVLLYYNYVMLVICVDFSKESENITRYYRRLLALSKCVFEE